MARTTKESKIRKARTSVPLRKALVTARGPKERRADERLVEESLSLILAQEDMTGSAVRAIGEHVIDRYFDGDIDLALSKNPTKPKSYAMLARRAKGETNWSQTDFRRAVKIAIAYRSLATSMRDRISPWLLERLASIDDQTIRREIAARIAKEGLRGDAAENVIAQAGATERRGGRPAVAGAVRFARTVHRLIEQADDRRDFAHRALGALAPKARRTLAAQLRAVAARLTKLAQALARPRN